MTEATAHDHAWEVIERGACEDGHDFTVSECSCGAEKHEWPETEEYILNDYIRAGLVSAAISHHYGALFLVAQDIFVRVQLARAVAAGEARKTDAALN